MKNEKIIEEAEKWETIETNFVKFEKLGDNIEGEITTVETIYKDKENTIRKFDIYTLKDKTGKVNRFHTSKQLDDLLSQIVIGDYIKLTFIDTQALPTGELKIFNLERKK